MGVLSLVATLLIPLSLFTFTSAQAGLKANPELEGQQQVEFLTKEFITFKVPGSKHPRLEQKLDAFWQLKYGHSVPKKENMPDTCVAMIPVVVHVDALPPESEKSDPIFSKEIKNLNSQFESWSLPICFELNKVVQDASAWSRERYLNVWIKPLGENVHASGQRPGGHAATDGIVINSKHQSDDEFILAALQWLNIKSPSLAVNDEQKERMISLFAPGGARSSFLFGEATHRTPASVATSK